MRTYVCALNVEHFEAKFNVERVHASLSYSEHTAKKTASAKV